LEKIQNKITASHGYSKYLKKPSVSMKELMKNLSLFSYRFFEFFLIVVENPGYMSISIVVLMFDNWWASLCWEK
jgi:hypothetical protein